MSDTDTCFQPIHQRPPSRHYNLTHSPMARGRILHKPSHSQNDSPYASGLYSTVNTSAPCPSFGPSPTTTYCHSPSHPMSSPVSDDKSASPLGGVTKAMEEGPLGTRARGRKRGKDGQEIWPVHLEGAFLQGRIELPLSTTSLSITTLLTISF